MAPQVFYVASSDVTRKRRLHRHSCCIKHLWSVKFAIVVGKESFYKSVENLVRAAVLTI